MRKLLLILSVLLLAVEAYATSCPTPAAYSFPINIPPQTALGGNLTSFPFTILGGAAFKGTANGGYMTDAGAKDFWVCTAATSGTLLPYVVVPGSYVASTGAIVAHIEAPTVYSVTTTETVYGFIGKSGATDQSCGPNGYNNCSTTLFANYLMWYDFIGGAIYNVVDGTTGTNHGTTAITTGPFGGGLSCTGTEWADSGETQTGLTNHTQDEWLYPTANSTAFPTSSRNSTATGGTGMIQISGVGIGPFYSNGSNGFYRQNGVNYQAWHYYAGTHTAGTLDNLLLYLDAVYGSYSSGVVGSGASDPANSSTTMQFCRDGANTTPSYYAGYIGWYALSNTVRSQDWITATKTAIGSPSSFATIPTMATTPAFSPSTGAPPQTVTISTTGACSSYVYWSTTDNPPTTSDTNGTSVTVSTNETIYAKVIGCPSYSDSLVGSATYSSGTVTPTSLSPFTPF